MQIVLRNQSFRAPCNRCGQFADPPMWETTGPNANGFREYFHRECVQALCANDPSYSIQSPSPSKES